MTRQELIKQSEAYIHRILEEHIPPQIRIFLYGSRARRDYSWNSDYDLFKKNNHAYPERPEMREARRIPVFAIKRSSG